MTLTVYGSAEEDRNLLSKLNSNIELTKVTNNKPVVPAASSEPLKTAETRPGATGNDFITSSHTEQSYSSSASFESSGGSPGSSAELGGGRGPGPVSSPAASSASYQVSGENFSGSSGEVQPQQNQQQQQQQAQAQAQAQTSGQQQGSPEVYSSSGEDTSSGPSSQSVSPVAYGRPDLNVVDFTQNLGNYPAAGPRALPHHTYGSSFEMNGQTYDLQRNPESNNYDNVGSSGEYNSAQNNVNDEGGYSLNQDTNK